MVYTSNKNTSSLNNDIRLAIESNDYCKLNLLILIEKISSEQFIEILNEVMANENFSDKVTFDRLLSIYCITLYRDDINNKIAILILKHALTITENPDYNELLKLLNDKEISEKKIIESILKISKFDFDQYLLEKIVLKSCKNIDKQMLISLLSNTNINCEVIDASRCNTYSISKFKKQEQQYISNLLQAYILMHDKNWPNLKEIKYIDYSKVELQHIKEASLCKLNNLAKQNDFTSYYAFISKIKLSVYMPDIRVRKKFLNELEKTTGFKKYLHYLFLVEKYIKKLTTYKDKSGSIIDKDNSGFILYNVNQFLFGNYEKKQNIKAKPTKNNNNQSKLEHNKSCVIS